MATPVIASFTGAADSSNTTTITLTKPSGLATGDLCVAILGDDDNAGPSGSIWSKSGWTRAFEGWSGTADCSLALFWRVADGTEGATEDFTKALSTEGFGWWLRITGADTTTPFRDVSAYSIGAAGSVTTENVTTVVDDLCISAVSFDGADGNPFSVSAAGWTIFDQQQAGTTGTEAGGAIASDVATGTSHAGAQWSASASDGIGAFSVSIIPGSSANEYDETGRATTITATTAVTNQLDAIDTAKATVITATTAVSNIASFLETLQNVVIASTVLSLDTLTFNDVNLSTTITSTTTLTDQADFIDALVNTITATVDTTDALGIIESIAISITSTIGSSDTYTPAAGDNFDETGRAITITATITTTDDLTMTESLATTITATTAALNVQDMVQAVLANAITSTTTSTDDLTMTEVNDIVGTVTVELLDLAALIDEMAIEIISFVNGSDTYDDGAPRSYYEERLWRTDRTRSGRNFR